MQPGPTAEQQAQAQAEQQAKLEEEQARRAAQRYLLGTRFMVEGISNAVTNFSDYLKVAISLGTYVPDRLRGRVGGDVQAVLAQRPATPTLIQCAEITLCAQLKVANYQARCASLCNPALCRP